MLLILICHDKINKILSETNLILKLYVSEYVRLKYSSVNVYLFISFILLLERYCPFISYIILMSTDTIILLIIVLVRYCRTGTTSPGDCIFCFANLQFFLVSGCSLA